MHRVIQAIAFAAEKHRRQRRKDSHKAHVEVHPPLSGQIARYPLLPA